MVTAVISSKLKVMSSLHVPGVTTYSFLVTAWSIASRASEFVQTNVTNLTNILLRTRISNGICSIITAPGEECWVLICLNTKAPNLGK